MHHISVVSIKLGPEICKLRLSPKFYLTSNQLHYSFFILTAAKQANMKTNNDDIFHAVTMAEDESWKEGYIAGVKEGNNKGYLEGFELGALKGSELGAEIGFYMGFATSILKNHCHSSESRIIKVCESILNVAQSFDSIDPTSENLTLCFNKLQGKFRQAMENSVEKKLADILKILWN